MTKRKDRYDLLFEKYPIEKKQLAWEALGLKRTTYLVREKTGFTQEEAELVEEWIHRVGDEFKCFKMPKARIKSDTE